MRMRADSILRNLYGGPAQPEITDCRGQISKLKQLGRDDENIYNPGQYDNIHVSGIELATTPI